MKNLIFAFAASLLFVSCSHQRETASGQKFNVIRKGDGKEVPAKNFLIMNFMFKDGKDSVWNDSRKNPYPLIMQKNQANRPGDKVLEVVGMLTKGDSVTFQVSAREIFKNSFHQPIPPKVDSTSNFSFYFGVVDVLDSAQFMKFREEMVAKQNEKALKEQQEQLGKDTVLIDTYLKEKNITAKKTASGLRYIITQPGKGENTKQAQTAKVNYAGHVLNGKYFDTSIESVAKRENLDQPGRKYEPYGVMVGQGSVIKGWDEMLQLMNKGMKVTVYIPSSLAYGSRQAGPDIKPNSILVFDMEVVDIK
ncbi:MAG: FKBP-type peptidyl-prolyl cis-trans isomerase [Bacteroidetes bacterium]|nr:FKBP-type peptidyl-prolyl cis-trans isomerase [Bacteroidota bacterium]